MARKEKRKSLRQTVGVLCMSVFRHGKSVVVEKTLVDTSVKTETKIEVDFRLFEPNDFPKIVDKFRKLGIDAQRMFGSDDMCVIGEAGGQIVHWTWITLNENYVMEMEKKIRMPDSDSAYVYAGYTIPEFRGLRIAPRAEEEIYILLHDRGIKKVFGLIESRNFASLKYHKRIGFRRIGVVRYVKILGFRSYFCRGETERDYRTIIEMLSTEEDRSKFQLIC